MYIFMPVFIAVMMCIDNLKRSMYNVMGGTRMWSGEWSQFPWACTCGNMNSSMLIKVEQFMQKLLFVYIWDSFRENCPTVKML